MDVDEGRHILQEVQSDFMRYVDARAIAQKARMQKIIPEAVEIKINESKSLDAAKQVLFEHLHDQVTLEGLRRLCSIMIESEGYQLMQEFGKGLQAKLEEVMPRPGSSQVSTAAASDMEMKGGIEQQHILSRAQRKRPPEGHADRERKQQKDSDTAEGQHILQEVQSDFMRYVDARAIAQKARMQKIIPEAVEIKINESKSLDAAKEVLFEHLHDQVMIEGLRRFCSILIESKGYQLMQTFGEGLLAKLEEITAPVEQRIEVCQQTGSDGIEVVDSHMLWQINRIAEQRTSDPVLALPTGPAFPSPPQPTPVRVLLELYQEKLVTEDEVKKMKGEGGLLPDRVVLLQFTKPPEVVARTAIVLDKYGHHKEASLLRGMAMAVNPSPDVYALSLESCKMDIVSCDVNVFESHKSPADAIRSLYFNAYNHLIRILSTHYSAIKSVALSAARTEQVSATEAEVKEACDLRALFECLEMHKKWNDLEFLSTAIMSLPVEASKEKGAAQLVLSQYKSYLTHYMKAVSIKEGKSALRFLQRKRGREERMVVSEITVDKEIDEYTCHDLQDLWKLFLIETLEIPKDRIEYRLARVGNSTTLVFMITQTYAEGMKEQLSKPAAVWVMKELGILRVYVAGVVCVDLREVLPNVLNARIHEGLESGLDFVSLTKVFSRQFLALVGPTDHPLENSNNAEVQHRRLLMRLLKALPSHRFFLQDSGDRDVLQTLQESEGRKLEDVLPKLIAGILAYWRGVLGAAAVTALTMALPTGPAFPGPPQPTPVRDPVATTPLPMDGSGGIPPSQAVALPTDPAFLGPPQQAPVRDPSAATSLPTATTPPPDTADIVEALNNQLNARWRLFGTFLLVDYQTMEAIRLDNGDRPDDCMLDLLSRWTSNQAGTGTLPRNWQTVVEAVRETGFPVIAENLAHKHGLTLSR